MTKTKRTIVTEKRVKQYQEDIDNYITIIEDLFDDEYQDYILDSDQEYILEQYEKLSRRL